jgi:hypothetical protein
MLKWLERRAEERRAFDEAWRGAADIGDGGLSNFQRSAIAAIEAEVGSISLTTDGEKESYLRGSVPGTSLSLYVYRDEAQVHGSESRFIAEKYDYDSPTQLIGKLVKFIKDAQET